SGSYVAIEAPALQNGITSLDYNNPVDQNLLPARLQDGPSYWVPRVEHTQTDILTSQAPGLLNPISTSAGLVAQPPDLKWVDAPEEANVYIARDPAVQDADESRLFTAGVLLGVAGAGAIAAVQETLDRVEPLQSTDDTALSPEDRKRL